jgi:hypothetical protein
MTFTLLSHARIDDEAQTSSGSDRFSETISQESPPALGGRFPVPWQILETVDWATVEPTFISSPSMRRRPTWDSRYAFPG